jgi:hypothetical protein
LDLISWMGLYEVNEKKKGFPGRSDLKNGDLTEKDKIKEDQGWLMFFMQVIWEAKERGVPRSQKKVRSK